MVCVTMGEADLKGTIEGRQNEIRACWQNYFGS